MLLWNVLLALIWSSLDGEFNLTNLAAGFVLGYAILWLMQPVIGESSYFAKVWQALSFAAFAIWKLILANLRLAYDIVTPTPHMRPAVVAIPLEAASDAAITVLANLITLTPGTLSLDISPDRRLLFIYAIYAPDLDRERMEIKREYERRLLELLR